MYVYFFSQVVVVQGGKIIKANQGASNGIVHVVDKFIEPSTGSLIDYLKGEDSLLEAFY